MNITNNVINIAIDYIINHLNRDISVEDVASHCHFSKFYFNRVFRAETGESVYAFIKRLRIERSALRLGTDRHRSITEIGLDYGYSPSNYSTAFKQHHHVSPHLYRKIKPGMDQQHPFYDFEVCLENFDYYDRRISIKELRDFPVLFKRYIGNYRDMKDHWADFIKFSAPLSKPDSRYIEITYDDPVITDTERCIYDLCMTIGEEDAADSTKLIQGGRCAVFDFKGSVTEIFQTYKGLFNVWLPESRYELDDRIGFDLYKKVDHDRNFFETEICIPIK